MADKKTNDGAIKVVVDDDEPDDWFLVPALTTKLHKLTSNQGQEDFQYRLRRQVFTMLSQTAEV